MKRRESFKTAKRGVEDFWPHEKVGNQKMKQK